MNMNYTRLKWTEKIQSRIAWAVPRWLAYHCAVRVMAHGTQGRYEQQVVPELSCLDALDRWDAEELA